MVVYIVHGFRWPRVGPNNVVPGIRAHIVSYNLIDAAAEYLQEPATHSAVLKSFKRIDPNVIYHLPQLRLIEPYDPDDLSGAAVSQPYAYVASDVITMPDASQKDRQLSVDMCELISRGPALTEDGKDALQRLKNFLAPEEKLGWWVVYNGDPERAYPESDEEEEDDDEEEDEEEEDSDSTGSSEEEEEEAPSKTTPKKPARPFS